MTESFSTADPAAPLGDAEFVHTRARVEDDGRPEEPRGSINANARLLVVIVCLGALFSTIAAGYLHGHVTSNWSNFLILAAAAAVAQLFAVLTPHNQSYHLAIVFVLAGTLILPPELVAVLCVVQHVPEWIKDRIPIEIQSFNIANYTLAAVAAAVAAQRVLGSQSPGTGTTTLVAGLTAGGVFVLVNHGVLAGMLRVARGHSLRQSGLFTVESLSTDLVLALIGVGLAAWWNVNLWFLLVAIAPLILVHRALSVPNLRAEASRDPKTGLYNAGFLNSALEEEMERAIRFGRPLSVIVADLDLLRLINNSYGHLSGDAVLLGVADVFRAQLRPYDVAARFGGEEFAVVLPETELDEAMVIAERIRHAVEEHPFRRHGSSDPVPATLSLGVSSYPQHAQDSDQLVHHADLALYRAKALGRNRVCGATAETKALNTLIQAVPRPNGNTGRPRGFQAYGGGEQEKDNRVESPVARVRARAVGLAAAVRSSVSTVRPNVTVTVTVAGAERRVRILIGSLVVAAAALVALNIVPLAHAIQDDPLGFAGFAAVVLALQLLSVDLYGSGAEGASAIGILAASFTFGPAVGIALAVLAAVAQWVRSHGLLHRALFDAANFALSAAAAGYVYQAFDRAGSGVGLRFVGAVAATIAYKGLNSGLLCLAMSISESTSYRTIWAERFRWASVHYLGYAPLAFASALAYEKMGLVGLAAFAVPPALLTLSARQYLDRTRQSVEDVRRANDELRRSNAELAASNQRARKTHLDTIAALSRSMEAKDHYTGGHTERVAEIAVAIAHRLGYRGEELDAIHIGGLLHDIGKIGVEERVLNKPGPLTEDEWTKMREHPSISDYILSDVDVHPFVRQIARSGHERIDGQGYPDGLAGNEIPLPARIMLVADAFDALTTDRPYRPRRNTQAALEEIRKHSGTQFCPVVVEALLHISRERPEILEHGGHEPLHAEVA